MTTNTEGAVTDVAAKLTEEQVAALVRGTSLWGGKLSPHNCWMTVGRPLKALGLIEYQGRMTSLTCLTPLGLAVRNHLASKGVTAS